ncbi:hypothetical protein [Candidatus Agathobaculum pullicola]|uniref:hypothetical protein n=1 Tax=Candidatus Agathobaculum pullicola TaxID=2838426 RepID=UPI003F91C239
MEPLFQVLWRQTGCHRPSLGHADAQKPQDFIAALADLQKRCNVSTLRLSGYGVRPEDFGKIADNAIDTMGGLFRVDPRPLLREDIIAIIAESDQ